MAIIEAEKLLLDNTKMQKRVQVLMLAGDRTFAPRHLMRRRNVRNWHQATDR
jgi:hypothetical protein